MNIQSMKDLLQEEKYHADSLLGIETEDLGEENLEHNPYSPNDIRALEDLPDVEGGDERYASFNYGPLSRWLELSLKRNQGGNNNADHT